jgi:hypothetical protein
MSDRIHATTQLGKDITMKTELERPKGDFIFHIINHLGKAHDVRVDSEIFEAYQSTVSRVLYIHAHNRDVTEGKPFQIKSRSWEETK